MAQFDVHRNGGPNRENIPYVVAVQSAIFDRYARRVVVPLVRKSVLGSIANPRFNPTFEIEKIPVVLHPLEIVSMAKRHLGEPIDSLAKDADRIVAALDELLSRAWG